MTHSELYLKFPNNASLAVQVSLTDDGLLVQGINRPDIKFWIGSLTALQAALSPQLLAPARDPLNMSPADVVSYFAHSPVLYIYADDVAAALQNVSFTPLKDNISNVQLENDLQAVKHLKQPSQADVAEILFGDRTKTGGSYRRRILAVLQKLKITTTSLEGVKTAQNARKAA